jgi:hypothetical protein
MNNNGQQQINRRNLLEMGAALSAPVIGLSLGIVLTSLYFPTDPDIVSAAIVYGTGALLFVYHTVPAIEYAVDDIVESLERLAGRNRHDQ